HRVRRHDEGACSDAAALPGQRYGARDRGLDALRRARRRGMIRVELPAHLRTLARVDGEVTLAVDLTPAGTATLGAVLDALEHRYPVLRGTIRDHVTEKRRPFVRFFACAEDLSHD